MGLDVRKGVFRNDKEPVALQSLYINPGVLLGFRLYPPLKREYRCDPRNTLRNATALGEEGLLKLCGYSSTDVLAGLSYSQTRGLARHYSR